jgi:carboxylate-amine ligase
MNLVMPYLPHLLALSANSPFWQAIDTGMMSCRSPLYGLVPHSGVPGVFQKWKDYREYFEVMRDAKAVGSPKDVKWDIRPRPDLGTLEFRVCDMPSTLREVFALAALTRSLVQWAQRLLEERPKARHGDRRRQWITVTNKWLAARYGLDAVYIRTPAGARRVLRESLATLLDRLEPVAEESGDARYMQMWRPVEKIELGAERQRRLYRENGDPRELIRDMTKRLAEELATADRGRTATRPRAAG